MRQNLKQTIWNLSSRVLSNEESTLLQFGLKYGLTVKPQENDILASAEAVWDQIERKQIYKDGVYHTRRAKNYIRAMAFNLLNLDDQQIFKDKKKVQIINNLKKDIVIVSPDKGSGIVLLDINEYKESMHMLFADRSKFRIRDTDPTNLRHKRGEIDDEVFKNIYPKTPRLLVRTGQQRYTRNSKRNHHSVQLLIQLEVHITPLENTSVN